jgi:hypothetical protein
MFGQLRKITIGVMGMRSLFSAVTASAVFLITGTANAAIVSADADSFITGTDISNSFAGLTLSFEGATSDGTNDGIIYSTDQSGALVASTGTRVFGTSDGTYNNLFGGATTTAVFRVDFVETMQVVSLDALGDDPSDFARLSAYTSGDLLIDTYSTGVLLTGNFETMTVTGADIAYVLAEGISPDAVGFDNLTANTVPIPAAVWLFASSLGLLGWLRRKYPA